MRRFTKIISLAIMLVALLSVSALAADFEHCADALNDLGLFSGTSSGYNLDRAPTRAEAAAMLVRLLGQDKAAQQLTYTAPFTDVPDWAKPSVQYLYENNLTSGKSATLFGSSQKCTAQQYATFLLRALGYSDAAGGDFTFATAIDFATEKGVADVMNCNTSSFKRDHVVAMSYTALATAPKSGETDLLTKLVKNGAISDAKGYDKQFAAYRDYLAAAEKMNESSNVAMDMTMDFNAKLSGMNFMSGSIDIVSVTQMNLASLDKSQLAYTMDMALEIDATLAAAMGLSAADAKMNMTSDIYYTDGYIYMSSNGEKAKFALSFEEAMAQVGSTDLTASSSSPVCMLKDVTVTTSGSEKTYNITLAGGAFNSILGSATAATGLDTGEAVKIDEMSMSVTVKNNTLSEMKINTAFSQSSEDGTLDFTFDITANNIKTGSAVSVTLPSDLSSYPEITG